MCPKYLKGQKILKLDTQKSGIQMNPVRANKTSTVILTNQFLNFHTRDNVLKAIIYTIHNINANLVILQYLGSPFTWDKVFEVLGPLPTQVKNPRLLVHNLYYIFFIHAKLC